MQTCSCLTPKGMLLLPPNWIHPFFKKNLFIYLFIYLFMYLFIYFWLCWEFVSVRGLSPVAASKGHSSSRCADLSLWRPLLLWGTGSRRTGSVVVAHGPSCSAACGIFPDQGSNPWHGGFLTTAPPGKPWIHLLVSVEPKSTTKPKMGRRKDLSRATSKENTGDLFPKQCLPK